MLVRVLAKLRQASGSLVVAELFAMHGSQAEADPLSPLVPGRGHDASTVLKQLKWCHDNVTCMFAHSSHTTTGEICCFLADPVTSRLQSSWGVVPLATPPAVSAVLSEIPAAASACARLGVLAAHYPAGKTAPAEPITHSSRSFCQLSSVRLSNAVGTAAVVPYLCMWTNRPETFFHLCLGDKCTKMCCEHKFEAVHTIAEQTSHFTTACACTRQILILTSKLETCE